MPNLQPANNVLASAVAGAVTGISQHVMVKYGVDISPDTQVEITGAVMALTAHLWDLATGQNVPPPPQGQMTPPPIEPPK